VLPLPARERDAAACGDTTTALRAVRSARGSAEAAAELPSCGARGVTVYVLSFLPTYIDTEIRELTRRGVAVTVVLPAPWSRSALWDQMTGFRHGADQAMDVRSADFRHWLVAPWQVLLRDAGLRLTLLLLRHPTLAVRCLREGTLRHLIAAQALCEVLDGARVERVHAHFATDAAQIGALLAALLGVPFSVTTHAHDIFVPRRTPAPHAGGSRAAAPTLSAGALPRWVRRLLGDAGQVFTISQFNRAHLQRVAGDDIAARVRVVHLGVDIETLPRWSPAADVFTVACTASGLGEKKGVAVLLEACRRLNARGRHWRWRICGADPSGERLAALRARIHAEGLAANVELLGALAWQDALAVVARANVFVHPSIRSAAGDMDGIPVSLLEAMGIGAPVIASRLSGIPELVDHDRTGILVPPGDAVALADAIEQLADEPARAAALARAGRQRVSESFSLRRSVDGLLSAWQASGLRAPQERSR
jgi:glycosyltransferase involved in cell wall biosynthesis